MGMPRILSELGGEVTNLEIAYPKSGQEKKS